MTDYATEVIVAAAEIAAETIADEARLEWRGLFRDRINAYRTADARAAAALEAVYLPALAAARLAAEGAEGKDLDRCFEAALTAARAAAVRWRRATARQPLAWF